MLLELLAQSDISALIWERLDRHSRTRLILSSRSTAQALAQHVTKIWLVVPQKYDVHGTQKLLEVLLPIAVGCMVEAPPLTICF